MSDVRDSTAERFKAANLKTRVVTAILIAAAFLLSVLLLPEKYFALAMAILFMQAAWEWSDLSGIHAVRERALYAGSILLLFLLWMQWFDLAPPELKLTGLVWLMQFALFFWCLVTIIVKAYPGLMRIWSGVHMRSLLGVCVLFPAWAGLVFLKQQDETGALVLWVVMIIALADIGAYFVGVRFGKHKLAVRVSPGKSWEGVLGGAIFNGIFVVCLVYYLNLDKSELLWLALATLVVMFFSVVGDLFESMLKRHRGVKDSGTLLPGHGGVLDRIDGWLAAVPVFTLAYLFFAV